MRMKPNHAGRQADPMQAEPGTLTEGVPRARIEHRNRVHSHFAHAKSQVFRANSRFPQRVHF